MMRNWLGSLKLWKSDLVHCLYLHERGVWRIPMSVLAYLFEINIVTLYTCVHDSH